MGTGHWDPKCLSVFCLFFSLSLSLYYLYLSICLSIYLSIAEYLFINIYLSFCLPILTALSIAISPGLPPAQPKIHRALGHNCCGS